MRAPAAVLASLAIGVVGVVGVTPSPAQAVSRVAPVSYVEGTDEQAAVFDPLAVASIRISMEQPAIDALGADPRGAYQPATVTITRGAEVWGPHEVGLRLKGVIGSFRWLDGKAAFKVKINAIDGSLRYHGLKKLTLNNMVQDGSYLHEAIAYRVFRAVGVAAPRVGYADVTFNGESYGLYANIETYDKPMLKRWFDSTQHLYEGSYWMDVSPGNAAAFEVDEGDPTDIRDLEALVEAANSDPARWWNRLGEVANRQQFVLEWATEMFLGHWDGYVWVIKNNYYLHSTDAGRFSMLPWGTDQTFGAALDYTDTSDRSIMFSTCMRVSACWRAYHVALANVLATVRGLNLQRMVTDVGRAIHDSLAADPRREFIRDWGGCDESCRQWATESAEAEQANTQAFIAARIPELASYLQQMMPARPRVTVSAQNRSVRVAARSSVDERWSIRSFEIQTRSNREKWRELTTSTQALTVIPRTRQLGSVIRVRAVTQLGVSPWSAVISVAR